MQRSIAESVLLGFLVLKKNFILDRSPVHDVG